MNDTKLKPCPFCGCEVSVCEIEPRIHRYADYKFCVVCNGCDLLFGFDEDYGGIFGTKKQAISSWNRRITHENRTDRR